MTHKSNESPEPSGEPGPGDKAVAELESAGGKDAEAPQDVQHQVEEHEATQATEAEINAVVTLTGTVDNLKAKRAAEQDAKNTVGVWRVKNHLRVRVENPPSDDKLAQNVKDALTRDPYVDRYQVGVSALNGVIYLSGTVDSYYEKSHAEDVASRVNGVTTVNNGLTVSYPTRSPVQPWCRAC